MKQIVREKGWVTGSRGALTIQLLKNVLLVFDKSALSGEKIADLVLQVQDLLSWKVDLKFFAGEEPQPAVLLEDQQPAVVLAPPLQ